MWFLFKYRNESVFLSFRTTGCLVNFGCCLFITGLLFTLNMNVFSEILKIMNLFNCDIRTRYWKCAWDILIINSWKKNWTIWNIRVILKFLLKLYVINWRYCSLQEISHSFGSLYFATPWHWIIWAHSISYNQN